MSRPIPVLTEVGVRMSNTVDSRSTRIVTVPLSLQRADETEVNDDY